MITNPFVRSFNGRKAFLPVVHAENKQQSLRNALVARHGGGDGIFLINHDISEGELLHIYAYIRGEMPDFRIGLNFLGLSPAQALSIVPNDAFGLWVDNAGIVEDAKDPLKEARQFAELQEASGWPGVYFGGVAFKGQPAVKDFAKAAARAAIYINVTTTSGDGTGIAPDPEKIKVMKMAGGNHPLAIASGITPENVSEYAEYADALLVATGISDESTDELNFERTRLLSDRFPR